MFRKCLTACGECSRTPRTSPGNVKNLKIPEVTPLFFIDDYFLNIDKIEAGNFEDSLLSEFDTGIEIPEDFNLDGEFNFSENFYESHYLFDPKRNPKGLPFEIPFTNDPYLKLTSLIMQCNLN